MDCAAAEGLYGLAEGAFGSDAAGNGNGGGDGGGQCPNANPLSDAECAGAVSNCWSPGQPDTDCPNYGLCCFDGCANTCVDGEGNYFLVKMIYEWFNPPLFFHFWLILAHSVLFRLFFFQCPMTFLSMVKVTIFLSKCSSEYWSTSYFYPPLYSIFVHLILAYSLPFLAFFPVSNDALPEPIVRDEVTQPAYVPEPETTPLPIVSSTGYNYPVPDVTLPVRPVTTPAPITQPPTLYGAPPPSRSGRQGRRRGRNGRRRGRRLGRKILRKRRL